MSPPCINPFKTNSMKERKMTLPPITSETKKFFEGAIKDLPTKKIAAIMKKMRGIILYTAKRLNPEGKVAMYTIR